MKLLLYLRFINLFKMGNRKVNNIKTIILFVSAMIVLLPLILNFLMQYNKIFEFIGSDIDWLSFWGGYLGALISSAIAFIILWITYKQNEKENKRNRELQLKSIEYQQQKEWLNNFRIASVDFCLALNQNSILDIINSIFEDHIIARDKIRIVIDNIKSKDLALGFVMTSNQSNMQQSVYDTSTKLFSDYQDVIFDIQSVNSFLSSHPGIVYVNEFKILFLDSQPNITESFKNHISDYSIKEKVHFMLINYVLIHDYQAKAQEPLFRYITTEERTINSKLSTE